MAIIEANLKLYETGADHAKWFSEDDDAGGRMSGRAITCGDLNNMFGNITRTDRLMGRFQLRKLCFHVDSATTDIYGGSHFALEEIPADENVSVILFDADATDPRSEERLAKITDVEDYVVLGESAGTASNYYGLAVGDTDIILLLSDVTRYYSSGSSAWVDSGGSVYYTFKGNTGDTLYLNDSGDSEYVQIMKNETITEIFVDTETNYQARTYAKLKLSNPLINAHTAGKTFTLTRANSAWKCYGSLQLGTNAAISDTNLYFATTQIRLVPTIEASSLVTDFKPLPDSSIDDVYVSELQRTLTGVLQPWYTDYEVGNEGQSTYITTLNSKPVEPGTITVYLFNNNQWFYLQDDGLGAFTGDGSGSVDYTTGIVTAAFSSYLTPDSGSHILFVYQTSMNFDSIANLAIGTSGTLPQTLDFVFDDIEPTTISVEITTASGKWELIDDGQGKLVWNANDFLVDQSDGTARTYPNDATWYTSSPSPTGTNANWQMFSDLGYVWFPYLTWKILEFNKAGLLSSADGKTYPTTQEWESPIFNSYISWRDMASNGNVTTPVQVVVSSEGTTAPYLYYRTSISANWTALTDTYSRHGGSVAYKNFSGLLNDADLVNFQWMAITDSPTGLGSHTDDATVDPWTDITWGQEVSRFLRFIKTTDNYGFFIALNSTGTIILAHNGLAIKSDVSNPAFSTNLYGYHYDAVNNYIYLTGGDATNCKIVRGTVGASAITSGTRTPLITWVDLTSYLPDICTGDGPLINISGDTVGNIVVSFDSYTSLNQWYWLASSDYGLTWLGTQIVGVEAAHQYVSGPIYNADTDSFCGVLLEEPDYGSDVGFRDFQGFSMDTQDLGVTEVGTVDYVAGTGSVIYGDTLTDSTIAKFFMRPKNRKDYVVFFGGAQGIADNTISIESQLADTTVQTVYETGGAVVGDGTMTMNKDAGYCLVTFNGFVKADSLNVTYGYPVQIHPSYDEIDGRKLPLDGFVPGFKAGDIVVIRNTANTDQDMAVVSYVTDTMLKIINPLSNAYPAATTLVSNAVVAGDIQASYGNYVKTSTGGIDGGFDLNMSLTNIGSETESWIIEIELVNTPDTDYEISVTGAARGVVLSNFDVGTVPATNIAPNNPNTSAPYFTLTDGFFGAGWQVGDTIAFDTVGAEHHFWIARVVNARSSDEALVQATLEIRGDI